MTEISIKQIQQIDAYWLVYKKDSGEPGHIQLSACANNFAIHHGGTDDGVPCVGVRYEKDGCGCYELFNVGHTRISCPLKPNPVHSFRALLKGKKADELLREEYLAIEAQLNGFGWKTIEEEFRGDTL